MKTYVVQKHSPPRTPDVLAPAAVLGGDAEWSWALPGVFHALSSPQSNAAVPAAPTAGDPHAAALGYWNALHHLLLYRLGWARPDLGLRWWFDLGKPVDDPTLALVAAVWDKDQRLDGYLSWLLRRDWHFLSAYDGEDSWAQGTTRLENLPLEWRRWLEATDQLHTEELYPFFNYPHGSDPLHLSGHTLTMDPDPHATLSVVDVGQRRAVLVTDRADAWYFTLKNYGDQLPGLQLRSWHVDVFVRSIGYMGTFRQSRVTGLWFTGRHHVHSAGSDPQ